MQSNTLEMTTTWIASRGLDRILQSAINEGLSGVRLILKGKIDGLKLSIDQLRSEARKYNQNFKIMLDLPGSKPRLGWFAEPISIMQGQTLNFAFSSKRVFDGSIPTEHLTLYRDKIFTGHHLLLNDGRVKFEILNIEEAFLVARLINDSATLLPNRSITLPDSKVIFGSLTEIDIAALKQLKGIDIDMVAISMVSNPMDVKRVRDVLSSFGFQSEIIAKIETPEAITCLSGIAKQSDSLMIARGDLTILGGSDNVFFLQEKIIRASEEFKKSVISATGLLTSLAYSEEPSIGELCDVGYLMSRGIRRFLIADAELSLNNPATACRWFRKLLCKAEQNVGGY